MADRLSARLAAGAVLTLLSLSAPAQGGGTPDPTRPPDVDAATAGAAAKALQAVLLRPHGRSVAIINGQTVAVGDKVGNARLVSLTATEAVLSGPDGKEILKLAPAAAKTRQPARAATRKGTSGRGDSHD